MEIFIIVVLVLIVLSLGFRAWVLWEENNDLRRENQWLRAHTNLDQPYKVDMENRRRKAIKDGTYPDSYRRYHGETFLEEEDDNISPSQWSGTCHLNSSRKELEVARQKDRMIEAEISPEDYTLEDELAEQAAFLGEGTLYAVNPGVGLTDPDLLSYLADPSWNAPLTASVYDRIIGFFQTVFTDSSVHQALIAHKHEGNRDMQKRYPVHCIDCMHEFTAKPGSELEERAAAREAEGFLDALRVHGNECPKCIKEDSDEIN